MLEMCVLGRAAKAPVSGKQIVDEIVSLTDGRWKPSPGSVYPILRRLEKDGLIRARLKSREGGRREIEYEITEAGRAKFDSARKFYAMCISEQMKCMLPVVLEYFVMFDDTEIKEMVIKTNDFISSIRSRLMEAPTKERKAKLKKMFKEAYSLINRYKNM
jgi:DNA-binding PadR family transcriptional regulator